MRRSRLLVPTFTLFLAVSLPATPIQFGQPGPQNTNPRGGTPQTFPGTPPTFPSDSHPSATMPPDTVAPMATESSNSKIEGQIRTAVSQDRRLHSDKLDVAVTDSKVMLDGEVANHDDRYRAIQIASDYAGARAIVDRLRLRGER